VHILKIERYQDLDALRGIAAIAVLFGHAQGFNLINTNNFGHTYLAVDLFFCLSGFVIANSYENKILNNSLSLFEFYKIRFFRFFPMVFLGGLLSFFIFLYFFIIKKIDFFEFLLNILSNFSIIPFSSLIDGNNLGLYLFNVNPPLWSLFFEMIVNVLFFIFIRNKLYVLSYVVFLFLFLFMMCRFLSFDVGAESDLNSFVMGFFRTVLSFYLGVICFKLHKKIKFNNILKVFFFSSLYFLLLTPSFIQGELDFFIVVLLFPLLILSNSNTDIYNNKLKKVLGDLSFPLYVIHYPIFLFFSKYVQGGILGFLLIILCILMSILVSNYIDIPLQKNIKNYLSKGYKENEKF